MKHTLTNSNQFTKCSIEEYNQFIKDELIPWLHLHLQKFYDERLSDERKSDIKIPLLKSPIYPSLYKNSELVRQTWSLSPLQYYYYTHCVRNHNNTVIQWIKAVKAFAKRTQHYKEVKHITDTIEVVFKKYRCINAKKRNSIAEVYAKVTEHYKSKDKTS